jgi:fatty acid desaturase
MQTPDIKPIMFLYLSGAIDILLTTIVICLGWGYETTTLYNWISPIWLMLLSMVLVNTVLCLMMMVVYIILHKQENPAVKTMYTGFAILLYGCGVSRLVFGAGSGVYVMMTVLL